MWLKFFMCNFQTHFSHWRLQFFLWNLYVESSTVAQVMLWHCQATSHYLNCKALPVRQWVKDVLNTLRPSQHGRHFADDTFKRIFLNENIIISIKISLKFVPKGPINNIPALVQIMAWRRPGNKPLSEAMMVIYWRIYESLGLNELIMCSERSISIYIISMMTMLIQNIYDVYIYSLCKIYHTNKFQVIFFKSLVACCCHDKSTNRQL